MNGPRWFALSMAVLILASLAASWRSPFSRALQKQVPVYGVVIGTDFVDNARHSDTLILVHYDPSGRSLDLLAIPRDTRVDIPGIRSRKINEVYAQAYRAHRNPDAACRAVADAVQDLIFAGAVSSGTVPADRAPRVQFYAQLDYDGFKKIVDLLGGVEVTVDEPMHYDDNWGKLHIHFDPGKYVLNGRKALEYVRFRGQSGDFGRVLRQQEFLMGALKKFRNPFNVLKLPRIVWISLTSVKTNLGWLDRALVLWEMKDLSRSRIRLVQLPGKVSRGGRWEADPEGVLATAELMTRGAKPSAEKISGPAQSEAGPSVSDRREAPAKTTVEVWNASSKSGLAMEVVRKLREAGFDVVKWGNYSSRQKRTLVRDHKGDRQQALAIAAALNSPRVEVFTRVEPDPLVDVEVILGQDYGSPQK